MTIITYIFVALLGSFMIYFSSRNDSVIGGCSLESQDEEDTEDCEDDVVGGIYQSYGALLSDISDLTFNVDGQLTAITMVATKIMARYKFKLDNTAFYNQTGSRTDDGAFTAAQAAFFKFTGLSKARTTLANNAKGSKKVFFVHFLNDGSVMVQGIDYNTTKDEWRAAKEPAVVNPNVDSKTGDVSSALEFNIVSVSKGFHAADDAIINLAYMDLLIV